MELLTLRENPSSPRVSGGVCVTILLDFCVIILCVHMFLVPYDLSLFAYNGVQNILCFVFALFSFVLYALCCHFIWIVLFFIRYSLPFICTLYPHCYRTNYRIVLKNKKQKNQQHSVNFISVLKICFHN